MLRLLGACGLEALGHLGKGEAKLDVGFQFSAEQAALALCRGVGELEKPEFDRPLSEGCVVIEAMVAAVVVVVVAPVAGVVSFVPNVR